MGITRQLRQEHQEILAVVERCLVLVRENPVLNAAEVHLLLQDLSQKVMAHFDLEEDVFYPSAVKDVNADFAAMARQYWTATALIRELLANYMQAWAKVETMQSNPAGFQHETEVVMDFLTRRIERENLDLYPIVE